MLGAGAVLETISAALGHSTISQTANTYAHAIEWMQAEHANRIEGVMGVPPAMKKPRGHAVCLVAPTGFEPVLPP